jgi:hypothetical protein
MFYLEVDNPAPWSIPTKLPFTQVPHGALAIGCERDMQIEHAAIIQADTESYPGCLAFHVIHDPARLDGSILEGFTIHRIIFLCRLFK